MIPEHKLEPNWCNEMLDPFNPDLGPILKPIKCPEKTIPAQRCEEGNSFGFRKSDIWTDLKCSGSFKVCFVPGM